jgi:glycosyltransferase involved in cell wall biosynthesis
MLMIKNTSEKSASEVENLVSVIIRVYNGERFLAEAIESVLNQDYRPIEIIVADDGSTDGSAEIAKSFPEVVYRHQSNQGVCAALNLGITNASGDYLAFLDADDIWTKNNLSTQMRTLNAHPEVDIVFGHHQRFYDAEVTGLKEEQKFPDDKKLAGYLIGTALIRVASFWRVGLFDPSLKLGDFLDWYSRAQHVGLKMTLQPEVVLRRRVHLNNTTYRHRENLTDYVRIMKATLDRRRQQSSGDSDSSHGSQLTQDKP